MALKVEAVQCPICDDIIYSCARHDFHSCTCGNCNVDGGFDYLRYGWTNVRPVQIQIEVNATRDELYESWEKAPLNGERKYGRIRKVKFKPGDIIKTKYGALFYITDEPINPSLTLRNRLFVIRMLVSKSDDRYHYLYEKDLTSTTIATDEDIVEELIRRSLTFEVEDASVSVDLEGPYFHINYKDGCDGISLNVNQVRELKRILNEFNV